MSAAFIGYAFGLYAMAFAGAGIVQFILNKLPPIKRRIWISYTVACVIGMLLVSASSDNEGAAIISILALLISMFFLYRRDSAKRAV